MNTPFDGPAVDRLTGSLEHAGILKKPAFVSVLRDCDGVPRCLEFACRLAASEDVGRLEDRSSILMHLRNNRAYFAKFVAGKWKLTAARALFMAFSGWVVNRLSDNSELVCEREELFKNGFLHVLSGGAYFKYGVPPIFCFLWYDLEESNDLLAAVIEFLTLDTVGPAPVVAEGSRFELVGALFRILSAADELVRIEAALVAKVAFVPKYRSILGLVNRPGFRCVAEAVGHVRAPAFMCPLLPNKYHLNNHKIVYDENLALLRCGRYMPMLSNHEGFDVLLVDRCEHEDSVFLTVIDCKFPQEKENGGVLGGPDLVKKYVDTLLRFPCLVEALLARRFCFIVASLQGLSEGVSVEDFADLVVKRIVAEEVESPLEITVDHVLDALVLLRRNHIKHLLTPTLESRLH